MILSNPIFKDALEDTQQRLRTGDVEWQTFDEVFS
jgi:hypothetical protein